MNRVKKILTKSKDEFDIFRTLAFKVPELEDQGDIILIFDVLCAKVPPCAINASNTRTSGITVPKYRHKPLAKSRPLGGLVEERKNS